MAPCWRWNFSRRPALPKGPFGIHQLGCCALGSLQPHLSSYWLYFNSFACDWDGLWLRGYLLRFFNKVYSILLFILSNIFLFPSWLTLAILCVMHFFAVLFFCDLNSTCKESLLRFSLLFENMVFANKRKHFPYKILYLKVQLFWISKMLFLLQTS